MLGDAGAPGREDVRDHGDEAEADEDDRETPRVHDPMLPRPRRPHKRDDRGSRPFCSAHHGGRNVLLKDFLVEYDHEMRQTRKLLERLPEDRLDFRPHPRSRTLGTLAFHVAELPRWTSNLLGADSYDLAPDLAKRHAPPEPSAVSEILDAFDANVAKAREHVASRSEEQLAEKWSLKRGTETVV